MYYSRSFTFENHTLSDITFEEKLSSDKVSTGLCDRLYSSNIVVLLNPRRSLILSLGTNVITGPSVSISMIDPSVEKFGLILDNLIRCNVLHQILIF